MTADIRMKDGTGDQTGRLRIFDTEIRIKKALIAQGR